MATGVVNWSKTAASNATADSAVNWAEGMAPSAVNDSARAEMAAVAKWRDDLNGTIVTTGGTLDYVATSNQGLALSAGYEITIQINATNTGTTTLNVDILGAKPFRPYAGTEFVAGELVAGGIYRATYATSNSGEWLVHGYKPTIIASNQVVTASINDKAVTYAKIQDVTDQRLLGNVSGGAAAPEEITIGQGLVVSGTTLTAPAFPPPAAFKNLSIKVASNTTVTVAADFVTTTDGTNYQTTAASSTINMGTTGADALDTGTIAIDTWYAIWVIAKSDGTTKCVASTSFTSPTMPSGYTYKARIGAVRTIHASATLYGTWQFGRKAQYVVGLAQTTTLPCPVTGNSGSTTTPTYTTVSISSYAPSTASAASFVLWNLGGGGRNMLAPNSSYGAYTSTTNPPPIMNGAQASVAGMLILESTNVYYASDVGVNSALFVLGWEDNI